MESREMSARRSARKKRLLKLGLFGVVDWMRGENRRIFACLLVTRACHTRELRALRAAGTASRFLSCCRWWATRARSRSHGRVKGDRAGAALVARMPRATGQKFATP